MKLVKVKLDVSHPNIMNLHSLDLRDDLELSRKSSKKSDKKTSLINPKRTEVNPSVKKSSCNECEETSFNVLVENGMDSCLRVKLVHIAPKIIDKVKITKIKKFLPALRYSKPKRTFEHQRSGRLPPVHHDSKQFEADSTNFRFKPELQTVAEKAENAEIDCDIMDIVHR